ncbi:MAG: DUF1934 domain-containing protein [Clostridia bacterium]|nr:DUF1934 domain-containing protein [Clostridia bacterium]
MPIEEYARETAPIQGKRVLVEMKSTQSDMTGVGFFTVKKAESIESIWKEAEGDANNQYSLVSEGILQTEDNRLVLSYEENAIEGVEGCTTVISFDMSSPECVTVERRGPLASAFVISRGERVFSLYSIPYGAIDMCIYAKKVENLLTVDGGSLSLDYAVELKGLTAQRTQMEVTVRDYPVSR